MEIEASAKKNNHMVSFAMFFAALICISNTNHNPTMLIERILRPIPIGSGTLHYAGILPLYLIYKGLKRIYRVGNYKILSTTFRRIIAMIVFITYGGVLCTQGIKFIKGFSEDLGGIYYVREGQYNDLQIRQEGNTIQLMARIELENCSNKMQEFYVELAVPEIYKEFVSEDTLQAIEENMETKKLFALYPGERKMIEANFVDYTEYGYKLNGGTRSFEFVLWNERQVVKFTERRL